MSMYNRGTPYDVKLKAGDNSHICQCGYSKNPPYCDGSHTEHPPAQPYEHNARQDETIWVCGCGKTNNKPFCDGSHNE